MGIFSWVTLGVLVGWFASMIMGRKARVSSVGNIIIGIVGASLGGLLASNLFGVPNAINGFNLATLFVALLSSAVLLIFTNWALSKNIKMSSDPDQGIQPSVAPRNHGKTRIENSSTPDAQSSVFPSPQKKIGQLKPAPEKKPVPGIIFVSYRRTDSADVAGRIYDRLVGGFGKAAIFKDVDSIPLGLDFKEYLDEKVSECNVLLAIIGDRWLEASDSRGRKRLEDPADFVRIEIESALARGIPIIPVLVRGASMPAEEELPAGLKKLAYRNGIQIRHDPDFHRDMDRLISALKGHINPEG